jgi:hypothetical protein
VRFRQAQLQDTVAFLGKVTGSSRQTHISDEFPQSIGALRLAFLDGAVCLHNPMRLQRQEAGLARGQEGLCKLDKAQSGFLGFS